MHPEASRLFALDEALRAEAEQMLAESGIAAILADYGYEPVGSYEMRTMTWRDLDFHRSEDDPDRARHWDIGTRLARTGWCVRLQCIDVYREQWSDHGLYWGIRVADPARPETAPPGDPTVWKLDLWTARPQEWTDVERRERWLSLMTDDARSCVLAVKEAICREPEYRKTMLSVHVYEAVLEHGIRDLAAFRRWWERTVCDASQ
jgi:hypothetical protein